MSSLCDKQIVARCRAGNESDLVFPFNENLIRPCSYDLRLGWDYKVEKKPPWWRRLLRCVEPVEPWDKQWIDKRAFNGWIVIHPGELILASSVESVNLTGLVHGRLTGRSTTGRGGLSVHLTADHIDPGYYGTVTFMIENHGCVPIKLPIDTPIAQIIFEQCDIMPDKRYGKRPDDAYQGSTGPTAALPFP